MQDSVMQKSVGAIAGWLGLVTGFGLGWSVGLSAVVAAPAQRAAIPMELAVPQGQTLLSTVRAEGDQIYSCQAKAGTPNLYEWTLKAPEAKLFQDGVQVGKHYGGPSWESNDGSKIVGQVKAKVNAPEATAIPWLLLEVKSHEGQGSMTGVNWVQRIHTAGGKAPTTGCDRKRQNSTVRVGYSSDYLFYGVSDR